MSYAARTAAYRRWEQTEARRLAAASMPSSRWEPRYPAVTLDLSVRGWGHEDDAEALVDRVVEDLHLAGVPLSACAEFKEEALSGAYVHTLMTIMEWVRVRF